MATALDTAQYVEQILLVEYSTIVDSQKILILKYQIYVLPFQVADTMLQ